MFCDLSRASRPSFRSASHRSSAKATRSSSSSSFLMRANSSDLLALHGVVRVADAGVGVRLRRHPLAALELHGELVAGQVLLPRAPRSLVNHDGVPPALVVLAPLGRQSVQSRVAVPHLALARALLYHLVVDLGHPGAA